MRDPKLLNELERFSARLDEIVYEQGLVLPADHDLVLFLEWREISQNGYNWIYYYVDHSTQTLFWVEDYDPVTDMDMDEVEGLNGPYDISEFVVISPVQRSSLISAAEYEIHGRYWYA